MEIKKGKLLLSLLILLGALQSSSQLENKVDFAIIDQYIEELMTKSTAEIPVWNIELRQEKNQVGIILMDA